MKNRSRREFVKMAGGVGVLGLFGVWGTHVASKLLDPMGDYTPDLGTLNVVLDRHARFTDKEYLDAPQAIVHIRQTRDPRHEAQARLETALTIEALQAHYARISSDHELAIFDANYNPHLGGWKEEARAGRYVLPGMVHAGLSGGKAAAVQGNLPYHPLSTLEDRVGDYRLSVVVARHFGNRPIGVPVVTATPRAIPVSHV